MKQLRLLIGVAVLLAPKIGAAEPEIQSGPPVSPVSWRVTGTLKPGAGDFLPPEGILGVLKDPASTQRVEFRDRRPYGEAKERSVWLVRYESVPVRAPGGESSASVPLTVAFDVKTRGVLCAFTDPAPRWAQSVWKPEMNVRFADKESTATMAWGEAPSPADYSKLHSSLTAVLEALWKQEGIAPDKAGQIILRPRFFQNTWPKKEMYGESIYPPGNSWIVEVLGRAIQEYLGQMLTSLVVVFRDEDLTWLLSSPMP